jgi:hypothetical protein
MDDKKDLTEKEKEKDKLERLAKEGSEYLKSLVIPEMMHKRVEDLVYRAVRGDEAAYQELKALGGEYEAPKRQVSHREGTYEDPLESAKSLESTKSIDELRIERGFSAETVREYISTVTGTLPPGVAMMLFVMLLTNYQAYMTLFSGRLRRQVQEHYIFFRDSDPWTQNNILHGLRQWFHDEASLHFIAGYSATARQLDRARSAKEEAEIKEFEDVYEAFQKLPEKEDNARRVMSVVELLEQEEDDRG